jgi:hypothetical protein
MGYLLVNEAFPEPWIDSVQAGASFVAEAEFDGAIVLTHWRRSDVARMLPPGLCSGRNVSGEPELHPVLFVFGTQARAGLLFGGLPIPTGVVFSELMIAIPFVRRDDGRNLHIFIPRIYSGDRLSTWSGNTNYGFNKELADMGWLSRTFTVSARDGPLLVHASVEPEGDWTPSGRVSGLAAVADVFRLPALGRRSDQRDVCSYFEWGFAEASARPARAAVSIDAPLGSGLDPGICHGVDSGTFEVRRMRWRVSWPGPCLF